jgi:hypothetical protein
MNYALRTNNVLLQILNRIPRRYLYLQGLFLVLLGASTFALLIDFMCTLETTG